MDLIESVSFSKTLKKNNVKIGSLFTINMTVFCKTRFSSKKLVTRWPINVAEIFGATLHIIILTNAVNQITYRAIILVQTQRYTLGNLRRVYSSYNNNGYRNIVRA